MISILQVEPAKLLGLKQAAYISGRLLDGLSQKEISNVFDGDAQLVQMWMLFLKHNSWIRLSADGKWSYTPKGQAWVSRVE